MNSIATVNFINSYPIRNPQLWILFTFTIDLFTKNSRKNAFLTAFVTHSL